MAAPMRAELQELINDGDKLIADIKATSHLMEVNGKGFFSAHELETCQGKCEESFLLAKTGQELTQLLDKMPKFGRNK